MLYVVIEKFRNMEFRKHNYFSDRERAIEWAKDVYQECDEVIVEEYIENDGKYYIRKTIMHWGEEDEE